MSKRTYNRLPLDLPTPKSRSRRTQNRAGAGDKFGVEEETSPIVTKILVSIMIVILIMIIKSIDSDFTQNVIGHVRDGITKDMDMDETLGKLKFVSGYIADAKAVFGERNPQTPPSSYDGMQADHVPSFTVPAEGKVTGFFGSDNSGIDILGRDNPKIYAVFQGKVLSLGENDKGDKYIRVDHGDNLISLYEGCSELQVGIGDVLNKGDIIGTMGQDSSGSHRLHFEVWMDGKPVDPLKMIEGINK